MREIENIASALFDKIRTRFDGVSLGDEKSKATTDPEKARFFNFDYEVNGTKVGNLTLSLIDEKSLKVYYSRDLVDRIKELDNEHDEEADPVPENEQNWYKFLRSLREFAKRSLLGFDTRDITKSNLQLKDIRQQSKSDSTLGMDDIKVTESRMHGTRRSSYQECGPVRIIVRHSDNVDEEKRGARSRNIESVFVETHLGERFLLPFKNLHGARAMAQHCSQGGRLEDELGECITGMVSEMGDMAHFVRNVKRREFEDRETADMAQAAVNHYNELKNRLRHIGGQRGYIDFMDSYEPSNNVEEEIDVDALRERFVRKIYDDRFNNALPYVYRAYQKQKQQLETPMGEEFENWANDLSEGSWDEPDSDDIVKELDRIMSKPFAVGPQGDNAIGSLHGIIGNDALFDKLSALASNEGDEADARPTIGEWLQDNGYTELANKYLAQYTQSQEPLQQQDQAVGQQLQQQDMGQTAPVASTGMDKPTIAEKTDPLDFIRSLAGLKK